MKGKKKPRINEKRWTNQKERNYSLKILIKKLIKKDKTSEMKDKMKETSVQNNMTKQNRRK